MTEHRFVPSFISNQNSSTDNIEETGNGLCLNNVYIPEEVLLNILLYVEPKALLNYSLVCRKWNTIIKSYTLWSTIYKRKYNKKPKNLPWYLYYSLISTNYFDVNLLRNGNGQDQLAHWYLREDGRSPYVIENPPVKAEGLPLGVPEFNNCTSCFATSYGSCYQVQDIKLGKSKLFKYILKNYKPHIYLSDWAAGTFDWNYIYKLRCGLVTRKREIFKPCAINRVKQGQGSKWQKMELTITKYPDVKSITFEHGGFDTRFRSGIFGSKMAGGVVKLLFDSIEPLAVDKAGNKIRRTFSKVGFTTNGEMENVNFRKNKRKDMWNVVEQYFDENYYF